MFQTANQITINHHKVSIHLRTFPVFHAEDNLAISQCGGVEVLEVVLAVAWEGSRETQLYLNIYKNIYIYVY